jgi:hypothetical protein
MANFKIPTTGDSTDDNSYTFSPTAQENECEMSQANGPYSHNEAPSQAATADIYAQVKSKSHDPGVGGN